MYIGVPLYISMIPKYLYDVKYFISIYKYIVFYIYIYYSYIVIYRLNKLFFKKKNCNMKHLLKNIQYFLFIFINLNAIDLLKFNKIINN